MIVHDRTPPFIYLTPPKTGTVTFTSLFRRRYIHAHFRGNLHDVNWRFVEDRPDHTLVVSVRNPFTRLVSHWNYRRATQRSEDSFAEWLDRLREDEPFARMRPPIAVQFRFGFRPEYYRLRVENIHEDVRALPFWNEKKNALAGVRRSNRSKYKKPWQEYYTPDLVDLVVDRFREDFDTFGYAKTLPD